MIKTIIFILFVFTLFSILSLRQNKSKVDEYYNHIPTIENLNTLGLGVLTDTTKYLAANTPLPYIITLIPAKILNLNLSLQYLRIVNAAISFICIVIIYYLFQTFNTSHILEKSLIIFFYPYYLKPSFTYYMAIWGLLFYLLFLSVLFVYKGKHKYLLSGLLVSFSILSQQFYLSIFGGILILLLIEFFQKKINFSEIIKFASPTIILFLPLLYFWGGLVPPNFNFHSTGIDITKVTSVFVSVGVISLPFVAIQIFKEYQSLREDKKFLIVSLIILSISIILAFYFYPLLEKRGGYEKITGISFNVIYHFGKLAGESAILLKIFIIFIGILFFYLSSRHSTFFSNINSLNRKNEALTFTKRDILLIFSIVLSIGFFFNILLAERHLLPLIVTILIYNLINFDNLKLLRLILMFYFVIGSMHFYYYMFITRSF